MYLLCMKLKPVELAVCVAVMMMLSGNSGGNVDDKMTGLLDDSKDHGALDSSIPLSPQWLYAKPNRSIEMALELVKLTCFCELGMFFKVQIMKNVGSVPVLFLMF
ncbi:hypothetical protein Tco_0660453 [Tanacetum coccineum]